MLKRLANDNNVAIDRTWTRYPSVAETSCSRCRGQGYVLRPRPNVDNPHLANYRAAPCPACSALK